MEQFNVVEVVNPCIYDLGVDFQSYKDERKIIEDGASISMGTCCSCGDQWSSKH